MKKILTSAVIVVVGILAMSQAVFADSTVLSATPSYASNVAGSVFNVSVKLDTANDKVCVVKGVINFTNLSCQNITMASGIMAQTMPTCEAPNFSVGTPNCFTKPSSLFSVSVKSNQSGQAGISFSGVKMITANNGAAYDVAFTSQSGVYDITAIPKVVVPAIKPAVVTPVKIDFVKPVINSTSTATTTVSSTTEQTASSTSTTTSKIANAAAAVLTMITGSYAWSLLVLIIILSLGYGLYYFSKKNKDN